MTLVVARTRTELRASLEGKGEVSLVPTMGALHDGHLRLLEHATGFGDITVASIFVNPTQFSPSEDFAEYPRTFDSDVERCEKAGVAVVFAPELDEMYPAGTGGITVDPGPLGSVLEGASRPAHFRGVLTVVSKLVGIVRPDFAVFGEKDYQQLILIAEMSRDLCMGVEVVGCPSVREADGLAMSSRNRYLSAEQREQATALSRALRAGVEQAAVGADAVLKAAHAVIDDAPGVTLDYLELTDAQLGEPHPGGEARLLIAARVGRPRLLDNAALTLGS